MNGKDKISVIIPCYNVQKYIMRCFDSIYSQTYGFENLELILIDDLSTDNTWSILESLQRKYPENVISLKMQKKGKCGGARNLGMDICTGKYITFVDADDYVHPDMLRVLYDRMTEDDYDVAQCGVSCFKADKPNVGIRKLPVVRGGRHLYRKCSEDVDAENDVRVHALRGSD